MESYRSFIVDEHVKGKYFVLLNNVFWFFFINNQILTDKYVELKCYSAKICHQQAGHCF